MRLPLGLAIVVCSAMALGGAARASSPAGTAVEVDPQAIGTLEGGGAGNAMATGDSIFIGQTVVTGDAGQVQIVFADETHLVIGPGSSLVISEYLMRNDGSASKFVIDALSGTFRFLTGNSPKNAYRIDTPTGTLGVRGTAFDLNVDPVTKVSTVLLYHGGVNMCGEGGCKLLAETCAVGLMPGHKPTTIVGHADKKRPPLLGGFRYLASQSGLMMDFRIQGTRPCKQSKVAILTNDELDTKPAEEPPSSSSSSSAPPPPSSSSSAPPPPSSSSEEPDDDDDHDHGHHYGWYFPGHHGGFGHH